MRIFISGPMTGYPDFNHPAFNEAAHMLRYAGHEVFNPAEIDGGDTTKPSEYYMRVCIAGLLECDGIVTLPAWEFSAHAPLEVRLAECIGVKRYNLDSFRRGLQ